MKFLCLNKQKFKNSQGYDRSEYVLPLHIQIHLIIFKYNEKKPKQMKNFFALIMISSLYIIKKKNSKAEMDQNLLCSSYDSL